MTKLSPSATTSSGAAQASAPAGLGASPAGAAKRRRIRSIFSWIWRSSVKGVMRCNITGCLLKIPAGCRGLGCRLEVVADAGRRDAVGQRGAGFLPRLLLSLGVG